MSFFKFVLLFCLLLDLSKWTLASRMGRSRSPPRSRSPIRQLHVATCPVTGCPSLVDPIAKCQVEMFCNHETGRCSTLLTEHSLNAIRTQRGEGPINWDTIANQQDSQQEQQQEAVATTPIPKELYKQLFPNGHPGTSANVNSLSTEDEDETEAEIDTAAGREAVKCPTRGHHIECKKDADCTAYDSAAYCVKNRYGDGLCYVDVLDHYTHEVQHRNRFK